MTINFNSINIPEDVQAKRRQWESSLAQQNLTFATFRNEVQKKINEEKLSFIAATYRTFDQYYGEELKASGITLTCAKGCSSCCHTFITSTEPEMDEAIAFINHLPREKRMPIVKRALAQARQWRDYCKDNQFKIKVEPHRAFLDWQKPCPFLNDEGACDIYPVRIADCRTLSTKGTCQLPGKVTYYAEVNAEGPVRYRFLSEHWASNLIMQTLQQRMGLSSPTQVPVTPILQLLYARKSDLG